MSIFKCKMCGGALEINNNESVVNCEYCGTQQTLPKLDDERRANLYDRANHFRRNNEYDKAMGIYEQILNEDNSDAEAYWSLVLCRYGIEYVEDPVSHKRVPTVNRAQFTSVYDDNNYKSALQYADSFQKVVYEEEAKAINEIQKGILAISQKEEPFDVFICYKETDSNGRRTMDSVLANDLYHQLTQEGFKVFFSRITLEDKLGTAYEPYIFAALNSAKVMVVLGTKPEYFKAVWVRNEWSRYLTLIKQGEKKMLIPAYKDMDPYDLPDEFSHLQAQDMSKLGFMQDLIRGIKKIVEDEAPKVTVVTETVITGGNVNIAPLLKRAFMFLEDGDWNSANEYCEKVLDIDPENASAYLGKLLCELRVRKQDALKDLSVPFDNSNNYQKAVRFADENLKDELIGYIEHINTRNKKDTYIRAKNIMTVAHTEGAYVEAARLFESVSDHLDSIALAKECYENAEIARKDAILIEAKSCITDNIMSCEKAIELLKYISGWKDADEQIIACQRKIEEIKAKKENKRKKFKRILKRLILAAIILHFIVLVIIVFVTIIIPVQKKSEFIATYGQDVYDKFGLVEEGEYITFGEYEQDNKVSNGKEDIEWMVLEVKDGKALLISKYALNYMKFTDYSCESTWEKCDLREWLNNDFINTAFSADEKAIIPTITVPADKNPEYTTNPGNATQDKVFLLSITEANKYFSSNRARVCKATDYAESLSPGIKYCDWYLRTPGEDEDKVVEVFSSGQIYVEGSYGSLAYNYVRPALWISLN